MTGSRAICSIVDSHRENGLYGARGMLPRAALVIGTGRFVAALRSAAAGLAGGTIREVALPLYDKSHPDAEEAFDLSAALGALPFGIVAHSLEFFETMATHQALVFVGWHGCSYSPMLLLILSTIPSKSFAVSESRLK